MDEKGGRDTGDTDCSLIEPIDIDPGRREDVFTKDDRIATWKVSLCRSNFRRENSPAHPRSMT